jgi:hypothetical protein
MLTATVIPISEGPKSELKIDQSVGASGPKTKTEIDAKLEPVWSSELKLWKWACIHLA